MTPMRPLLAVVLAVAAATSAACDASPPVAPAPQAPPPPDAQEPVAPPSDRLSASPPEPSPPAANPAPEPPPAVPVPVPQPPPQDDPPVPSPPDPVPSPPASQDPPTKPLEDAPAVPPAKPAEDAAAAEAASDAKAREILGASAALQNAGDLAAPGKLESFHVVFDKAIFERDKTDASGNVTTQMVETDKGGLVFDWKAGSIKTAVTIDGSTTTKAWYEPRKIGWIHDGTKTSSLLGADYKADYDQLQFHRTVINQLLDVAILAKMLADKSRWRVLADSAPYENTVALQRTPPADAPSAVPITLWIQMSASGVPGDVIAASMPPLSAGDATIFYRFSYHADFPAVRVKGDAEAPVPAKLRFPFGVSVYEQHEGEEKPRKVLEVFTRDVSINTVADKDFAQPR